MNEKTNSEPLDGPELVEQEIRQLLQQISPEQLDAVMLLFRTVARNVGHEIKFDRIHESLDYLEEHLLPDVVRRR